jgi:hypothetical protein
MEIKDKVCSFEQSVQLHELGIKPERSDLRWFKVWDKKTGELFGIYLHHINPYNPKFYRYLEYHAFDVAELYMGLEELSSNIYYSYIGWTYVTDEDKFSDIYPTQAQCAAAFMIHLFQSKLISVHRVNDQINKISRSPLNS